MSLDKAEVQRRFKHYPPGPLEVVVHEGLREAYLELAEEVASMDDSREKSLAITALEESLMWANAHVARNISGRQE